MRPARSPPRVPPSRRGATPLLGPPQREALPAAASRTGMAAAASLSGEEGGDVRTTLSGAKRPISRPPLSPPSRDPEGFGRDTTAVAAPSKAKATRPSMFGPAANTERPPQGDKGVDRPLTSSRSSRQAEAAASSPGRCRRLKTSGNLNRLYPFGLPRRQGNTPRLLWTIPLCYPTTHFARVRHQLCMEARYMVI